MAGAGAGSVEKENTPLLAGAAGAVVGAATVAGAGAGADATDKENKSLLAGTGGGVESGASSDAKEINGAAEAAAGSVAGSTGSASKAPSD